VVRASDLERVDGAVLRDLPALGQGRLERVGLEVELHQGVEHLLRQCLRGVVDLSVVEERWRCGAEWQRDAAAYRAGLDPEARVVNYPRLCEGHAERDE